MSIEVAIKIDYPANFLFIVANSSLVKNRLQAAKKKWGKSHHVNQKELDTQLSLIEHFEKVAATDMYRGHIKWVELYDDHWNSTKFAFITLLKSGDAYISNHEKKKIFNSTDLLLSKWSEGEIEGMTHGGEQFTTKDGELVLKYQTWLS